MKSYDSNKTRLQKQSRNYYRHFSEEEKENAQAIDIRACLMRKNKKENNI